jgi:hypothetical protein
LTHQEFTNLSVKDCRTEGGLNHSFPSGKNSKPPKTKSNSTLDRLPLLSKSGSSEETKISSGDLISKNTSKKRSFVGGGKTDFEALEREYHSAMEESRKWELLMYDHYSRDDYLKIVSMIAYLKNVERGFAWCNDENHYASIRREDVDGRLFNEAMRGFELAKRYMKLGPIIWKWKATLECKRVRGD